MKLFKTKVTKYKLVKEKTDIPSVKISRAENVSEYAQQYLYGEDIEVYESMWLLLLNRANNVVGFVRMSQGSSDGTIMDIKMISTYAVQSLTASMILIHNHPTGNIEPSTNDSRLTKKLKEAMDIFNITVLDHVIVEPDGMYYSFADNGKI
jgi:DNA repair protein RadC